MERAQSSAWEFPVETKNVSRKERWMEGRRSKIGRGVKLREAG